MSKIYCLTFLLFSRTMIFFLITELLEFIKTKNNLLKESQICMYVCFLNNNMPVEKTQTETNGGVFYMWISLAGTQKELLIYLYA